MNIYLNFPAAITIVIVAAFLFLLVDKLIACHYEYKNKWQDIAKNHANANRRSKEKAVAELLSREEISPATAEILKSLSESLPAEESGLSAGLAKLLKQVRQLLSKS